MHSRGAWTAALVAAVLLVCSAATPAAADTYTTEQCRELVSCTRENTQAYYINGGCQCCDQAPVGGIAPQGCYNGALVCPEVMNCRTCPPPTACSACINGYVLETSAVTCTKCLAPMCDICATSSDGKRCQLCTNGYYWTPGGECAPVTGSQTSGSGMQCRMANCHTCESSSVATCSVCNAGFTPDANGVCVDACRIDMCDLCYTGNTTDCQLCAPGHRWTPTTCTADTAGCRVGHCTTCTAGSNNRCETCAPGYSVTAVGYCLPSCTVPHCVSCPSSAGTCSACAEGYGLVNNVCERCSDPNCIRCDGNVNKCTQCAATYYVTQQGTCAQGSCNIPHCELCDPANPSRCQRCASPYLVDSYDGLCRLATDCAVPQCKQCVAGTSRKCEKCNDGYDLSSDRTACNTPTPPCDVQHCQKCVDGDRTRCAYCNTGYYVSQGRCLPVQACYVANCAQCMLSDSAKCSTCMNGYLLTSSYHCVSQRIINGAAAPRALWVAAAVLLASAATYLA